MSCSCQSCHFLYLFIHGLYFALIIIKPFQPLAKYCKRLYRDVTSTNQGKLTWNTIKPIIQGRILYTPANVATDSVVKFVSYLWGTEIIL